MTNLTKFDIAVIGVKLLAVYLTIVIIEALPNWIMTAGMIITPAISISLKLGLVFLLAISIIFPVLLWVLSNKIAYIITASYPESSNTVQVDNDLQAILFRGVGMYVLIMALPQLILWLYNYITIFSDSTLSFSNKMNDISVLIAILIKIIFSVILIFSAKNISMFFSKLRSAGVEK